MAGKLGLLRRGAILGVFAGLIVAGSADAAILYVDDGGSDNAGANTCTVPTSPCMTVTHAYTKSHANDEIQIGAGTYVTSGLYITHPLTIRHANFNPPGTTGSYPLIDGGNDPAFFAGPGSDGIVFRGLRLHGGASGPTPSALVVTTGAGEVTVDDVRFVGPEQNGQGKLRVDAGHVLVKDSVFLGNSIDNLGRWGILVPSGGTGNLIVEDSTFSDLAVGIQFGPPSGDLVVRRSEFTGVHNHSPAIGYGIQVDDGRAVIEDVLVTGRDGDTGVEGIALRGAAGGSVGSAYLNRVEIRTSWVAVTIALQDGQVSISDSLLVGARGITATNTPEPFEIRGSTVIGTTGLGPAFFGSNVTVHMDSTIIGHGQPGEPSLQVSGATCTHAYSRTPPSIVGQCGPIATADPGFVDVAGGDYRLAAGSPLIDAGNPADPPVWVLDLDLNPRAVDGDGDCVRRRDIGAYEFIPSPPPDCDPPETTILTGPAGETTSTTPTFTFRSSKAGSTFQCRVDGAGFGPCSGPGASHTTAALALGPHTFQVRAISAKGIPDPTPASRAFTVVAPDPSGGTGGGGTGGGGTGGDGPGSIDPPDTTAPVLGRTTLRSRSFRVRRRGSRKGGTRLRTTVSEDARLELRYFRVAPGHRLRGRCRTGRKAGLPRCTTRRSMGRVTRSVRQGKVSLPITGRVGRRTLRPGRYELRVRAVDAAGNRSPWRRVRFKVVR